MKGLFSQQDFINAKSSRRWRGFTIVELLIVVVVIAILAAITIVAYNGIASQAKVSVLKSDLTSAARQLHLIKVDDGSFPSNNPDLQSSEGVTLTYAGGGSEFCLQATNEESMFHIQENGTVQEGVCPVKPLAMQQIAESTCPEERTLAYDIRDNHTYWVQKMPDGKCWMLTNLAYSGGTSNGGNNNFSDVIGSLQDGTTDADNTYTEPKYYIYNDANPTIAPAEPSTHSNGGGSTAETRQVGYHYNWCAAMGVQLASSACSDTIGAPPNTSISICPAGWRLPTGGIDGELESLSRKLGSSSYHLRPKFLAQYSGYWRDGRFYSYSNTIRFWSSTQTSNTEVYSLYAISTSTPHQPPYLHDKGHGVPIRCVAT